MPRFNSAAIVVGVQSHHPPALYSVGLRKQCSTRNQAELAYRELSPELTEALSTELTMTVLSYIMQKLQLNMLKVDWE